VRFFVPLIEEDQNQRSRAVPSTGQIDHVGEGSVGEPNPPHVGMHGIGDDPSDWPAFIAIMQGAAAPG
jgi:hypothetical protein